ncbi:MAG: 4Fe-4S binding protein [Eubacteriaceae bacterium]|nr:4Fe-4S binding protein [Eubacteriaceae bacterium]
MAKIELTSELAKQYGIEAGATLVGICASSSFEKAPAGFKPNDILENCRSVIVLCIPFTRKTLSMEPPEYTALRNAILTKMTEVAKIVAKQITKKNGYKAKAISASGGKTVDGKMWGHISLKHAAALAGLGVITRNYLLTNPQYGNRLWFSAVLTDAELVPDETQQSSLCENCNHCVDICPVDALSDQESFGSKECSKFFQIENKKFVIKCWKCRTVCPYSLGEAIEGGFALEN